MVRLTHNQRYLGFGLCYLYLSNHRTRKTSLGTLADDANTFATSKSFAGTTSAKRVYRVYRSLALNLRIKPEKRPIREKPNTIAIPEAIRCDNGPEYVSLIPPLCYDWLRNYLFD